MALNLVCAVLDRGPEALADMAVLLAIADSADKDTGEAWPSQRTIARRSRQTDRSVRKVLVRLRDAGWLTWEARTRPNGTQASNVYTLNLAKLGEERDRRHAGSGGGQGRNHVPPPRNDVPPPPEPRSAHAPEPRSALEPSQKKEPRARGGYRPAQPRHRSPHESGGGAVLESLTAGERFALSTGKACVVGGVPLVPSDAEYRRLAAALAVEAGMAMKAALAEAEQ